MTTWYAFSMSSQLSNTANLLPKALSLLASNDPSLQQKELQDLKRLSDTGLKVAPILVVPAGLEEYFYRLNNLPAQLSTIFAKIKPKNPDEDNVEDAAPLAQALLKRHYLLDEIIDMFYEQLEFLPERVTVRRAGSDGKTVSKGRPALMALKDLWTDDWSFEAVLERLERSQTIGLEARPTLITAESTGPATNSVLSQAKSILGRAVELEINEALGITKVSTEAR
jgi:hypothetical protein